jgi:hypothetical protein
MKNKNKKTVALQKIFNKGMTFSLNFSARYRATVAESIAFAMFLNTHFFLIQNN